MNTGSNKTSSNSLKVAEMVKSGKEQTAAIDRGAGIYENTGIGNSYLIKTNDGDVLINAGTLSDARRGKPLFENVSSQQIRHIILTQSHANQFGGLEIYKTAENQVIAHQIYPEDRAYSKMLNEHYRRGSRRIFRTLTGPTKDLLPTQEVEPDLLINEKYSFALGGRQFDILWTPGGETRSALIVWLPTERIAIVGNLFGPLFGNHPNLNTLRGDKPRSALEFINSVKKVRELNPVQILTGHEDIRGEEHLQRELTRIIDSVQWVHDQTVTGMNEGVDLSTLMQTIKTPKELTLTEEYSKLAWNVRAIWHEYTGWYDPSRGIPELYGASITSVAKALVELSGGEENFITKARDFTRQGKPLEALQLLDIVLAVNPISASGKDAKIQALQLQLDHTGGTNLWERMSIVAEQRELEDSH